MKRNGFTLIELIVTLVIAVIVLSIAIPTYHTYITRARLTEAFDALSTYRVRMEQAYQDVGSYAVNGACAITLPATAHFNYSCTLSNSNQSFVITATGNGVDDISGYVYTVNESGLQRTTAFPSAAVPANCWLSQTNGC